MKRFIASILCLLQITSTAFAVTPENANDDANSIPGTNLLYTTEPAMPEVDVSTRATGDTISSGERALWCDEISSYLEGVYGQDVVNIYETSDAITFEFDNAGELDLTEGHILKVEYIKPEATNSDYQRKLTYMWGWAEDYFPLDSAKGKWGTVKDKMIEVAGLSEKISVATMVSTIIGLPLSMFFTTQPVDAESTVKYYFLNKIGQIKDPKLGIWAPYAYVGSRKDFKRCLIISYDEYGQPHTEGVEETVGKPSSNPTNYDAMHWKPHFSDSVWILDKAVSSYERGTGAYIDVYGWPPNMSDTPPK